MWRTLVGQTAVVIWSQLTALARLTLFYTTHKHYYGLNKVSDLQISLDKMFSTKHSLKLYTKLLFSIEVIAETFLKFNLTNYTRIDYS